MRISKVGHDFGTSLRRHTQPFTSPIIQSSPTRTRVLYWRWKKMSLWGEGFFFVASIANRTLWKNAVVDMVKDRCPLCGCTISSLVASQLHHFQPKENSTRKRCTPQTTTSSLTLLKKCNEDIGQKAAVDILNTTLILLKKESTRSNKQQNLAWNHACVLTRKGMVLMEEAFNNVKVQDFKVHLTENKNEHTAIVSKKTTSHRE